MLTPEEVRMFKKLVMDVYHIVLTDEEATDQGSRLIQLFEIIKNKAISINTLENSNEK